MATVKLSVKDRKGIIGGSDIGAILGYSTYKTEHDVWEVFTGKVEEREIPEDQNFRLRVGAVMEQPVADLAEEKYGIKLRKQNSASFNSDRPWLICHPDRIVEGKVNGKKIGVEIKTSSPYDKRWGDDGTDQVPYDYLYQCLSYMACGVCDEVWLIRETNHHIYRYIIERDDELISDMVERLTAWVDKVKGGYEPENVTAEVVVPVEGSTKTITKKDDAEICRLIEKVVSLKKERKEYDIIISSINDQIKKFMGDNRYLVNAVGDSICDLRYSKKQIVDNEKLKSDYPHIYKECLKTSESTALYTPLKGELI